MNVRVHSPDFKYAALLGQIRVLNLTSRSEPTNLLSDYVPVWNGVVDTKAL